MRGSEAAKVREAPSARLIFFIFNLRWPGGFPNLILESQVNLTDYLFIRLQANTVTEPCLKGTSRKLLGAAQDPGTLQSEFPKR